jgi:hypothetical protein
VPVGAGIGSPYATIANAVRLAFEDEFAAEGLKLRNDQLHPSLGRERVDCGIYPVESLPMPNNHAVMQHIVEVQVFDIWRKSQSPDTIVNPSKITEWSERFQRALAEFGARDPGTGAVWYFDVTRVRYPKDPTGNNTRFVATIRAFGDNVALSETA